MWKEIEYFVITIRTYILSWLIFELSHVHVAFVITLLFSMLTLRFMVESFSYIGYFSLSNANTILGDLI